MIRSCKGSLFDSGAEALINPVNCVGVMGKGLALQFKWRHPSNFQTYRAACKEKKVKIGSLFITKDEETGLIIINFPTKIHWADGSQLEYIHLGLIALRRVIVGLNLKSIAIPMLGCGNGQLNWNIVSTIVRSSLKDLDDVDIMLYE